MTTKKKIISVRDLENKFGRLTFGRILESFRQSEVITQKDFAYKLGITPSSLCDLEKGRRIPSLARARKIAQALDLNEIVVLQTVLQDQLDREGLDSLKVALRA